ncbi:DUF3108 domain-containing protein [Saccharicrinis aurantiacus]|uniref:DUF3108 domain-containing protein n=1 Tax=Saccharicrinis aurantiacus TaxID=1849719 RepID=UPI00094F53DA|nr:DUF3108 domain-containing protein [Saccharicrinis aurantiacus]
MRKLLFVIALFVGLLQNSYSQCNVTNFAFQSGEVVTYHAYYNWHFIWINAGIVHFSVEDKTYNDKDTWFLSAYGKTYPSYDKFMTVRDTFETYIDKSNFNPLFFNRVTKEGSTVSHHQYNFDYENNKVDTHISKGEPANYKDASIELKDCTGDLITMVYKARNLDFSNYNEGDKIPIRMIVDGEIHDLYIRYLGKQEVKTRNGRKFRCLKFTPLLVEGTIFSSGEGMTVYVTDDKNRIPVVVEAKILVGSVKAMFVDVEGARYPLTSEITK